MFSMLPASSLPRELDSRGVLTSVFVHVALIATAVWITAAAGRAVDRSPQDVLPFYVAPARAVVTPPAPRSAAASTPPNAAPATAEFVVAMPEIVSSALPAVSIEPAVFDWEHVLLRRGGGTLAGTGVSATAPGAGDAYAAAAVEQPVQVLPNQPAPRYPETLRVAGVDGLVVMRFIVDTLGRVEPSSIAATESSHALFTEAVRAALLRQRFIPAETGGRRVRQLVLQPFSFVATR